MTIEDLALLFTRGIGSRGASHLVDYFGTAEALFSASRAELMEGAGLRADLAERILRREGMADAEAEIKYARRNNICIISATDDDYPEQLRDAVDRPHILFVQGNVEALKCRTLSMVGTREMTPSGLHACNTLVEGLKGVDNLAIVSGLAYGVDSACHRAALANDIPTIAVVPTVLPEVVPAPHRALADEILRKGGAIVSELHSKTRQNGQLFIARNRIIAGLGMGLVVVESPSLGGSLATADIADSYGRTIMAVPGRLSDMMSFGTNNLIRTGRARLVLTARDIIADMGWERTLSDVVEEAQSSPVMDNLSPAERLVLDAFTESAIVDWPSLMSSTGLSMGELAMATLNLEMAGLIRTLPGKRYEKV